MMNSFFVLRRRWGVDGGVRAVALERLRFIRVRNRCGRICGGRGGCPLFLDGRSLEQNQSVKLIHSDVVGSLLKVRGDIGNGRSRSTTESLVGSLSRRGVRGIVCLTFLKTGPESRCAVSSFLRECRLSCARALGLCLRVLGSSISNNGGGFTTKLHGSAGGPDSGRGGWDLRGLVLDT